MAIQTTNVSIFEKVRSLGASFFQKYTPTKTLNKKIAEMNDLGLCDLIICVTADTTTDFGSLKVGDHVLIFRSAAGTTLFQTVVTVGTLPVAGVAGQLYIVLRPNL